MCHTRWNESRGVQIVVDTEPEQEPAVVLVAGQGHGGEDGSTKQCVCSPSKHPGSFRCRHHQAKYVWRSKTIKQEKKIGQCDSIEMYQIQTASSSTLYIYNKYMMIISISYICTATRAHYCYFVTNENILNEPFIFTCVSKSTIESRKGIYDISILLVFSFEIKQALHCIAIFIST